MRKYVPNLKIHVNVSYVQIIKAKALKNITKIISNYILPQNCLVIELTESGFIESNSNLMRFCNEIRKQGILLSIDDFGTGYSNLHYLYNLKPDLIKIDRTLMRNAFVNDYEKMLLSHMIEMAHSVGAQICIEGVETVEYHKINQMQPDYTQGYNFSKPCSLDNLKNKITKFI